MKYWETRDGDMIPYKDLENSHLLNILRFIEKKAEDGIVQCCGGFDGVGEPWYDEETILGDAVKEYFDYDGLKQEAVKRKLII